VLFFRKLGFVTRIKLFKAFCSRMYGCELWSLNDTMVGEICAAWCKASRRIINVPYSYFQTPFLYSMKYASAQQVHFVLHFSRFPFGTCCCSSSIDYRQVYNFVIGSNALLFCDRYGWTAADFWLVKSTFPIQIFKKKL